MNSNEAIMWMLQREGVSQQGLAEKVGMKRQSNVSMMLRSEVKVQTFAKIAEELGYDIILRDKKTDGSVFVTYDPDFESKRSKK